MNPKGCDPHAETRPPHAALNAVVERGFSPLNYRACNRQVAERNVITIEERP